ncbi:MAG: lipid-binding SYLF domain-containing protein [Epsilonproteobacteria bacterium]|nr:lipid-binding SYLF domain-containing protein [Campylobacterota bacterium]
MKKAIYMIVFALIFATHSFAGASEELLESANTLKDMLRTENKIPPSILQKSLAIVVIPNTKRVGFFIGGEFGKGVASIRKGDGTWSNPFFIKLSGGSFGWQFGFDMNSILLIFNSPKSVNSLLSSSITMGVDASISAGPLSKTFEKNSKIDFSAEVFSYRKSKGLFLGASLKGAVINQDNDKNIEYYGNGINAKKIVNSQRKEDSYAMKEFFAAISGINK